MLPKSPVHRSVRIASFEMATAKKQATKSLTSPQRLTPAKRKAAVKGVAPAKARAIAEKEPVAPKVKRGKTAKPLAPERVAAILDALRKTYPNVVCALIHHNAFELTIATILSAQTTDVGVNKATPELFRGSYTKGAGIGFPDGD